MPWFISRLLMQPKPQLSNTRMLTFLRSCIMVMISLLSIRKLESPTTQYTSLSGSANFTPRVAAISYPMQE